MTDNIRIRLFALNWFLWIALLWLGQFPVFASHSLSLAWYPSLDPAVVGYKIYFGGASGNYTNSINVGSATNATVYGLTGGATYYFSATSVSSSGVESIFSNEATYVIPADTNAPSGGTGNQPPTLDPIASLNIYQNAGPQTVNLTGISAGSSGNSTVTVSAVSSTANIISTPAVNYTSSSGTGTLSFAPTGTAGSTTVTVTVNNGGANNNLITQTFTVTVLPIPVTSKPPTLNAITNLTVYENSGLQTVALTGISAGSGGNATVTISAVSSATAVVPTPTINYTNLSSSGILTFAPASNALGTATVTVTVNNGNTSNNLVSQAFTITVVSPPVVSQPPTLNAITNLTVYENSGLQTVALTGISTGSGGNPVVTISAVSSAATIIPTPTINYTSPSSTGTLTFTPAANALGTATVTVTVNNGGTSNNLISRAFTVTVVSPPVVSSPPTLNAITNLTINESSGLQTVALTGISAGSGGNSTVTISAASSNTSIIPTPTVNYSNPNSFGTLTFTPKTNVLGSATVTVTANNGAASNNIVSRSFTVTVVVPPGGNQPPTLNPIANITVVQGTGSQSVALTGITSGSSTEKQTLKVSATSSNTKLIPTPTISYTSPATTGVLTLKPSATNTGTATITVTVNDGGKSNNIVLQSFTVTVVSNQPPTLNPIANVTVLRNAGNQAVALTGISSSLPAANQVLAVTAASSNTNLISTPTIKYTSPATTGMLVFKSATNSIGTATITVTVNNGGPKNNLVQRSFTVTVTTNPALVTGSNPNLLATLASVIRTGGHFSFQVTGVSGGNYIVQATSDLVHWTTLQTNTAPFTFQESATNNTSQRYYRATYLP